MDKMKAAESKRVAGPPRKSMSETRVALKYFLAYEEKENVRAADVNQKV